MILAARTSIAFGSHTVDASTTGEKSAVPASFRPSIGALAFLAYKTGSVRYDARGAGGLVGSIKAVAGDAVLGSTSISGDGSGTFTVDLAVLQGQENIDIVIDVSTAGEAATQIQAVLDVDQPVVMSGC